MESVAQAGALKLDPRASHFWSGSDVFQRSHMWGLGPHKLETIRAVTGAHFGQIMSFAREIGAAARLPPEG